MIVPAWSQSVSNGSDVLFFRLKRSPHAANRWLLILCWLIYTVAYLARAGISAGFGTLAAHFGTGESYLGMLGSLFFGTYAIGQLVNGYLGDRFPPVRFIAVSMAGSVAVYALALLTDSAQLLPVLWGLNGVFLSMLWGPMLRLLCMRFGSAHKESLAMLMGAAPVGGYCLAWLWLAPQAPRLGWQAVFGVPLVLTGALIALWIAWSRAQPPAAEAGGAQSGWQPDRQTATTCPGEAFACANPLKADTALQPQPAPAPIVTACSLPAANGSTSPDWSQKRHTLPETLRYVRSQRLWPLVATSLCLGLVKENLALLLPALFIGFLGLRVEDGAWLLLLSPAANLSGLLGGSILKKPLVAHPARSLAYTFLAMGAMCAVLAFAPGGRALAFAALFLLTALAYLGSCIQISYLPLSHVSENMVSTLVGLFDFANYLGAALSSALLGALMAGGGWREAAVIWLAVCLAAMGLALAQARKPRGLQEAFPGRPAVAHPNGDVANP